MQHPLWDDEMKFELFRFRSELRTENIRVLAQPLGLGLQPVEPQSGRSLYPPLHQLPPRASMPRPLPPRTSGESVSLLVPPRGQMPSMTEQQLPASGQSRLGLHEVPERPSVGATSFAQRTWWFFAAHLVDLGFIGLCLSMGLMVLVGTIDPASFSWQPHVLAQSAPMLLLAKTNGLILTLAIYALFTCYWLFFKIVSGVTLGESILHNFKRPEEQAQSGFQQESRDS